MVDTGSVVSTVAAAEMLDNYTSPSSDKRTMRSATSQKVQAQGEGALFFQLKDSEENISIITQHIPEIASNILSPGEVLEKIDYDLFTLSCNRRTGTCYLKFAGTQGPTLSMEGHYRGRLPYLPLVTSDIVGAITRDLSSPQHPMPSLGNTIDLQMPLVIDLPQAINQVTHACMQLSIPETSLKPTMVHNNILNMIGHTVALESMTALPGHKFPAPIFHLSDAVQRTLWHLRTVHPNPDCLMNITKAVKGIPKIKYP